MKTTLDIDDSVMDRLKRESARQGRHMSDLVESALRLLFKTRNDRVDLPPLPAFRGGEEQADIADGDTPYHAMEER